MIDQRIPEHSRAFVAILTEAARRIVEDRQHPSDVVQAMALADVVRAVSGRI